MDFNSTVYPRNDQLKEYFTWRATAVTKKQQSDLINHFADEICLNGRFLAYVKPSEQPVEISDGVAKFPLGTKIAFPTLTAPDGKTWFPVFTDKESIDGWQKVKESEPMMVGLTFDDFLPLINTNPAWTGILINPFSDHFGLARKVIIDWTKKKPGIIAYRKQQAEKEEQEEE